jgi:uncharacterized membrane protein
MQVILPPGPNSISYVVSTGVTIEAAQTAIDSASAAILKARSESRTSNLAAAESLLEQARTALSSGDYAAAKSNADSAYTLANSSKAVFDYTLAIWAAAFLVIGVGAVIYVRRRRPLVASSSPQTRAPTQVPTRSQNDGIVKLELVFQKHPDLRMDDKEVVRFLAERGGEAFANEIRDRFEIPRTSTWRMIRRLMSAGIVEERKIGGQSLIYVAKKYREAR